MKKNTSFIAFEELLLMLVFAFGLIVLFPLIMVPLDWRSQAWLGLAFVLLAVLANRLLKAYWVTYFLMALSLFSTARYAWWRTSETLGFNSPDFHWYDLTLTLILYAAELYAWIVLVLGFLQTANPLKRKPLALPSSPSDWPAVDVYIPTYNEPIEVVRPTVLAAMQMDWPADKLNVCLLDDGVRAEFREFARDVGIQYIIREKHTHAKAGNLNHAMTKTNGKYIAIFDCDHVPTRSFLQMSMGWFLKDDALALVQTPHHFYSPDPFERNLKVFKEVPNEGELFYGIVQDGNDLWDATFFCGSCAVLRREALDEIGGIAIETVTEDAHTSLKFQRLGWKSAYINVPQAAGLATESFSGHVGQRVRWARGMAQIMRIDNPLFGRGLQFMQRLCYLNAMLHFFFALPRLIFLTAPLLYLYFGLFIIDAYAPTIAAFVLPHLILAIIANSRVQGKHRNSFWNEVYETALAPFILLPTLLAVINPKLGKFNVTAKGGLVMKDYFDKKFARPFIILFLLNIGGLIAGVLRWWGDPSADVPTIVMTVTWTVYNLFMILVVLGVNWETRQLRKNVRIPIALPARVAHADGAYAMAKTVDISEGGGLLICDSALQEGESLDLSILFDGNEYVLPIQIIKSEDHLMRFRFRDMNHAQFSDLVRLIYGRADAWVGWGEGRRPDQPLRSLFQISYLAMIGFFRLIRGLLSKAGTYEEAPTAGKEETKPEPDLLSPKLEPAPLAGQVSSIILALLCAVGFLVGSSHSADAADSNGSDDPVTSLVLSPTGLFQKHWSVRKDGAKDGLNLYGINGIQDVSLSLPPNLVVSSAEMNLIYQVSPGLLPRISQINVLFNDQVVGSFPVKADDNQGKENQFSFSINPNLFVEYNHVGFQLIGHYTMECEDPTNTTLWAKISPQTSLVISGSRLALSNDLSFLPAPFFYPSDTQKLRLPFVFMSAPDAETAQAAGIVASWFGMMADYRGSDFPVEVNQIPAKGNAVVFGVIGQGILPGAPKINGSTLAVTANPNDPYGKILWVLGENSQQLNLAAQSLVLGSSLLKGATAHTDSVSLPAIPGPDSAPRWVPSTGPVRLDALTNYTPMTVRGTGTLPFTFDLPPSLFFWESKGITLSLHYSYNSIPLAKNSSLNLEVNDQFIRSYQLLEGDKAIQEQRVEINFPESVLSPFANQMKSNFFFVPIKGNCTDTPITNAAGTIYPSSTIDISGIPHYARMPELSTWVNGGYPFTRFADLSRTAVVLPAKPDVELIHTYLNLLGLLGQFTGMPGIRLRVANSANEASIAERDLMVFNTPAQLAMQDWHNQLPVTFKNQQLSINDALGWFDQVRWRLPWWQKQDGQFGEVALGKLIQSGVSTPVLMQETISPFHSKRVLLSFTSDNAQGWKALQSMLLKPSARANIFGELSVIHGDAISSYVLDRPYYYVGALSWLDWMRFHLSQHIWAIWLGVVILTLVLAKLVDILLKHLARKRLAAS